MSYCHSMDSCEFMGAVPYATRYELRPVGAGEDWEGMWVWVGQGNPDIHPQGRPADVSHKKVGLMEGSHTKLRPYRPLAAQKGKRSQRAPMAPRAPGPNEEDPRVKCRDCGAFGHKASSSRCPMKHWAGALVPQALGSRKLKENVEPRSQQDQQNPGSLKQAEREKGEGQRQEAQQRVALLQRFPRRPQGGQKPTWKDCTESCSYVRRPQRPMPVYTTKRESILEPPLTWEPPTETPDMRTGYHLVSPLRSPAGSVFPPGAQHEAQQVGTTDMPHLACQPFATEGGLVIPLMENRPRGDSLEGPQTVSKAQAAAKGPEENSRPNASNGMVQTSQIHLKTPGKRSAQIPLETGLKPQKEAHWSPFQHPHKSIQGGHLGVSKRLCPPARSACGLLAATPVTRKTPAPGQSINLQPARTRPHLETVQACTEAPHLPFKPTPGKPLRMVFMRLDKGCWSSRFLVAPSFHPPVKSGPPGQGRPIVQTSEGRFSHVPLSVLHDDLQVSSSSEDSGRE
ncbi:PREDICTED: putative protein FAM90A14P-like [Odobenus rosmarus divergens]|uniref:Zinc knuckle domain-containing protein n=1 Tax=Odobenus rosmarus divergens TaxID=9708 RepID=A0A9B0GUN1_ODORO